MSNQSNEQAELEKALEADQTEHSTAPAQVAEETDNDVAPPHKKGADYKARSATKTATKKKASKPRLQDTRQETKEAQDKARKEAIAKAEAEAPELPDLTEAEQAEETRRGELREKIQAAAERIDQHEEAIEALKTECRELMAELYPHQAKSDRHVDAVRAYLKSSQAERQNRGAHPARLKELLMNAGKAPIDVAMVRSRARGTKRPKRSPMGAGASPPQDQAKSATPGSQE